MLREAPARCPTCDSDGKRIDEREHDGERFQCFECDACTLQYWWPRHIDRAFYAADEHGTYDRRRSGEAFLRPRHLQFLDEASPGNLLDVGCGEGSFLLAARQRGFSVAGIDLDPGNIATARSRGIERVSCGLLFDDQGEVSSEIRKGGPYDWVTAFEVLEHQSDPMQFLDAARGLLRDGGHIFGSVPNRNRVLVRRDRGRSYGDFPPHHFLWFSARSLELMVGAAGFHEVTVGPVVERNITELASFLENTLLGGITGRVKQSTKASLEERAAPRQRRTLVNFARTAKNLPFVPLALGLRTLAPDRSRSLFFRATL